MTSRPLLGLVLLTILQIVAISNANSDKFQNIEAELVNMREILSRLIDTHEETQNKLQNVQVQQVQQESKIEQLEQKLKFFENKTVEVVELYKLDADKKCQTFLEKVKNSTCACNNSTISLIVEKIEAEKKVPTVTTLPTILPIAMEGSSAVYDGKDSIYILGGRTQSVRLNDILQFNITSENIERVAKLPIKVQAGTAIWDGEGVVNFGGSIDSGASNKIHRYIPGMKEAVEVGQLPFANRASATTSHRPGDALIFGGFSVANKVVHYNCNESVANVLSGRSLTKDVFHAPAVYYSTAETESVFLFGGDYDCSKEIIKYNVKTGQSVIINETLPFGLRGSNAFLVGKYIYVFGGSSRRHGCIGVSFYDNVVRFNPENNQVESLVVNGFPSSLSVFSAVYIKNLKRAFFFGGMDDSVEFRNQILKLQF